MTVGLEHSWKVNLIHFTKLAINFMGLMDETEKVKESIEEIIKNIEEQFEHLQKEQEKILEGFIRISEDLEKKDEEFRKKLEEFEKENKKFTKEVTQIKVIAAQLLGIQQREARNKERLSSQSVKDILM